MAMAPEPHSQRKRQMMPHFQLSRLSRIQESLATLIQSALDRLEENQTVYTGQLTQDLTLEVICTLICERESIEDLQPLMKQMKLFLNRCGSPVVLLPVSLPFFRMKWLAKSPYSQFERIRQDLFSEIQKIIQGRLGEKADSTSEEKGRVDILGALLSMKDEEKSLISHEEVAEHFYTLTFAGHETTASTLAWAIYQLEHSSYGKKLTARLRNEASRWSADRMCQDEEIDAFVKEVLRRYPAVPLGAPRRLTKPLQLRGKGVSEGVILSNAIYLTHTHAEVYPKPFEFHPERFLEREYSSSEFQPFCGGIESCLGWGLSLFELKIAIYKIATQFDILPAPYPEPALVRKGVTFRAKNDLPLRMRRISPSTN